MEKIACILRDEYINFYGVWGPFKLFLKCGGVGSLLIEDQEKRWYCILM